MENLFPFILFLYFIFIYLLGIFKNYEKNYDKINLSDWKIVFEKWNDGIRYILYSFIFILILMSIGRIGTVLIIESHNAITPESPIIEKFNLTNDGSNITLYKDSSDNSKKEQYYTNYEGITGKNFTSKLIALDEILFVQKIYGSIPERLLNEKNSENIVANMYIGNTDNTLFIAPIDIQSNKSVNISRTFTSEPKQKYAGYFGNISLSFIRSEIARILFLIILINIYSLVKCLIEDEDKGNGNLKKKLNNFANLLLSTLVLGLILTLLPQGDVGDVILTIDLQTGISAFLIIISFIIISFFKLKYLQNNSQDTQNIESKS